MQEFYNNIRICPIAKFLELKINVPVIMSTSYQPPNEINTLDSCLVLEYDDVDIPLDGRSITESDCKRAADFIINHDIKKDILYCCCDSGISRSSAIAAAAARYYELDDMLIWGNPHYSPNALVYSMMCDALGRTIEDYELDFRISVNRKALSFAIRSKR